MRTIIKVSAVIMLCGLLAACEEYSAIYPTVDYINSGVEVEVDSETSYHTTNEEAVTSPTEKEPWQIAFAPIINAYIEFFNSWDNWQGYLTYDEELIGNSSIVQLALGADLGGSVVYAFHDLNGDGVPELLIGTRFICSCCQQSFYQVPEIYTLRNGKPVALIQSWSRISRLLSVDIHGNYIFRFVGGRDRLWQAVLYTFDENGELTFFAYVESGMSMVRHYVDPSMHTNDWIYVQSFGHAINLDSELSRYNWISLTCDEAVEWLAKHGAGRFWPDGSRDENEIRSREPNIEWKTLLS